MSTTCLLALSQPPHAQDSLPRKCSLLQWAGQLTIMTINLDMPTVQIDLVNPLILTTFLGGSELYEVKTN